MLITRFFEPSRLYQLAWVAWGVALFLLPFNRFGGVRNAALLVLLVSLLGLWRIAPATGRLKHSRGLIVGILLVCWALLVSIFGPYPAESLSAISKDLLFQGLLLAGAWRLVRNEKDIKRSLLIALAGFLTVSFLSVGEIVDSGFSTLFSANIEEAPRRHNAFWGGYAASASVYLPMLVGICVLLPMRSLWRAGVVALILFVLLLTVLYGSRSALLIVFLTGIAGLLLARRFRTLLVLLALLVSVLIGLYNQADLGYLNKYKSLSKPETYVTNQGLGLRLAVWQGAAEVISERPWLGFGYGWKKLAWVINDNGYAARWRAEEPELARYYLGEAETASYGRVNPHNYVLQVVFELGVIGFGLVLAFWAIVVMASIRLVRYHELGVARWGGILLLTLVGYFLSNINNGYWVGGVANFAVAIAGMALALYDESAKA
jgi:O-antigen ligase